ncbi:hypothetical protein F5146DRAFT_1130705 [Armillaria mellea]|nr:hypothetical protein F5146DRAFT_1130705 [Armillaria mellea]
MNKESLVRMAETLPLLEGLQMSMDSTKLANTGLDASDYDELDDINDIPDHYAPLQYGLENESRFEDIRRRSDQVFVACPAHGPE